MQQQHTAKKEKKTWYKQSVEDRKDADRKEGRVRQLRWEWETRRVKGGENTGTEAQRYGNGTNKNKTNDETGKRRK